jgi:hypothetical protein
MPDKTCETCRYFNFKVSGEDSIAWGNCLSEEVQGSQYISLSLVHEIFEHPEPEKLREAIRNYARIEYREDIFGCRFWEAQDGQNL